MVWGRRTGLDTPPPASGGVDPSMQARLKVSHCNRFVDHFLFQRTRRLMTLGAFILCTVAIHTAAACTRLFRLLSPPAHACLPANVCAPFPNKTTRGMRHAPVHRSHRTASYLVRVLSTRSLIFCWAMSNCVVLCGFVGGRNESLVCPPPPPPKTASWGRTPGLDINPCLFIRWICRYCSRWFKAPGLSGRHQTPTHARTHARTLY